MAWEGKTQIMLTTYLATHVKSISTLMCNVVLFSPEQDLDSLEREYMVPKTWYIQKTQIS
jgi:hypothetical protein